MMQKFLWLMYSRMRICIGIFAIVMMYGAYNGMLNLNLILIGAAFFLIELFGGTYNDYLDYDEDVKNQRTEKWTVSGLMTVNQIRYFSYIVLLAGLAVLLYVNPAIFLVGLYYTAILFSYSHPRTRLKNFGVYGYLLFVSMWLFFPLGMDITFSIPFSYPALIFGTFCFFQYAYILMQKDCTDMKDNTNVFLKMGWSTSFRICALFAFISSILLLTMSLPYAALIIFAWGVNTGVKFSNLKRIRNRTITRKTRSRLIMIDYLTPYLYTALRFL